MDISLPDLMNIETVGDCQKAIEKLKSLRHALLLNGSNHKNGEQEIAEEVPQKTFPVVTTMAHNGASSGGVDFFDSLTLIDVSELPVEDEMEWLRKAGARSSISIEELENDRTYMDTDLLNVQFVLLNLVKGLLFEEKTGFNIKESSPPTPTVGVETPPSNGNTKTWDFRSPKSAVSSPSNSSFSGGSTPSAINSPRGPVIASSPLSVRGISQNIPDLDPGFESESAVENEFYVATPPKNIDTRTYTRPKKTRTSLEGHLKLSGLSNTLTVSKGNALRPPALDYMSNRNTNLNETYIQEDSDPADEGNKEDTDVMNTTINLEYPPVRKIQRNLSYVIRRGSHESTNENSIHNNTDSREELNSTFTREPEGGVSSPTDSNSSVHNISMEELHTMARLQEQSLKMASASRTVSRKDTQVIMEFPNLDGPIARPPARTSSTDTYCLAQSNPESPGSSGLSSPLDSQSYDDIPSSGDAFRRSMPNLAVARKSASGGGLSLAPPLNTLQHKNHYISDSKLTRPSGGSRLTVLKYENGPTAKPIMNDYSRKELNLSQSRLGSANGQASPPVRRLVAAGETQSQSATSFLKPSQPLSTRGGLQPPRYTSAIPQSKNVLRSSNSASMLPAPGFASTRPQSRIPAPGSSARGSRLVRPSTAAGRTGNNNGRVPDWREGCY